ncbi:TRAP transporter substrate-binding protein [Salinibacillus xinjiangensis]|uniref:C4-dicarboxylate ABC transporter substrate-binding protein n=1 Tax=Salinibacillus xinjiangensis TaxID=1229268 RepID=A0A6G1X1L4_9BACI|nr:TRAP transporter substrate-binding protein [Salinibacillus xinjiangensis]MRG84873.1 hypothetical protein [Salinibacillus xinjiangensis]
MKKIYFFSCFLFLLMFLVACSNGDSSKSNGSQQQDEQEKVNENSKTDSSTSTSNEEYVLKLAHGFPTGAFHHTFMEWFAEDVHNRSDGRLTIDIFPSGQLMPPDQEVPAILQGQIDMSHSSSPVLAGFDPIWNVYELPFIFDYDPKDPGVFLENRIKFNNTENGGQKIAELMEEEGLKVISLGFTDMFGSVFTTSVDNLVTGPESAEGLKLRTPGGMIGPETAKAIGASSTTIAGSEVVTALQQNVVDGLLTTPLYAYDAKLPIKSFSVVPLFNSVTPVIMSLEKFESLPKELQDVLVKSGTALEQYAKEKVNKRALEVYSSMEEEGVEVYYPSEEEIQAWNEATQPARELFKKEVEGGSELLETLESIK